MKNLFTLSERLKGWLVGMVKLVMQSLKATKRQSDTTIFAKSLKSLMSIFSSRGVMDVRLSLGQYRTDYQRISNLYLTPNRYFTRFAAVFALVFVLGVGNVWGADPTEDIVLSSGSFSTDHITWSGTSCTIQQLKGTSSNAVNSSYISAPRVYKGHVLSFVAKTGYKIKSISIKVDGTYYGNSMTAGTTISSNTVTNNTTDVSRTWTSTSGGTHVVGSVNAAGLDAIYIQNVASSSNVQLRFTKITITYVSSTPSYTVTASSNNNSWGTVSVSGTTITATPADCYQVASGTSGYNKISGTGTITHTGNSNTISVTPTSNCSIQVIFEKKIVNTYVDEIQGNEDIEDCETHDAPSLDDKAVATSGTCAQQHYHFVGWVTAENKANPTDANVITAGTEMTANGTTYYAVWAKQGNGGASASATFTTYNSDGSTDYSSGTNDIADIVASSSGVNSYTGSKVYQGTYGAKIGSGSAIGQLGYSLSSGVSTKTITIDAKKYGSNSATLSVTVNGTTPFGSAQTPSADGGVLTYSINSAITVTSVKVATSSKQSYVKSITVGNSISYTDYKAVCCTELASINGSTSNATQNSVVLKWKQLSDQVDAWAVTYREKNSGNAFAAVTTSSTSTETISEVVYNKYTISGLGAGKTYEFKLTPTLKSGVCPLAADLIVEGTTESAYTISAETNNSTYGTVSISGNVITGSPKSGYRYATPAYMVSPANSATVAQDGNNFTVTPSANTTVTINFEAIPSYSVSWVVNGGAASGNPTTNVLEGGQVETLPTPPTVDGCDDGKTFVGWTATPIDGSTNTIPSDLFTNANGSPVINTAKTFYAVFATPGVEGEEETDVLTQTTTGITGTNYTEWSGKTVTTDAVYAGQSAGGNNSIQLRSDNSNSGVITTTSGGKVKKVTVSWNSNTANGRTINIYGKNTAYEAATDLYDNSKQGTLLGSLAKGTTELNVTGNYEYIGIRSSSGALYLSSVSIKWETVPGAAESGYITSCTKQVAVTATAGGSATIDGESAVNWVNASTEMALVATPDEGYVFAGWTYESSGTVLIDDESAASTTVITEGAATITANFVSGSTISADKSSLNLEAYVNEGGSTTVTFTSSDAPQYGTVQYTIEDNTYISVSPASTYLNTSNLNATVTVSFGDDEAGSYNTNLVATAYNTNSVAVGTKIIPITLTIKPKFTVTVAGEHAATKSASPNANVKDGTTVTLSQTAADGWVFQKWTISYTLDEVAHNQDLVGNTFTMPAADVTATAVYTEKTGETLTYPTPSEVASITSHSAVLSWSAVEHASSYSIYITDGDAYEQTINGITETSYTITGLKGEVEYMWTVTAIGDGEDYYNSSAANGEDFTTTARVLSSIAIKTNATKMTYNEGETFDKSGLEVTATYDDASTATISAANLVVPAMALTAGTTSITVSYTENAVEQTTTLTGITVNSLFVATWNVNGVPYGDPTYTLGAIGTLPANPSSACNTKYPYFVKWVIGDDPTAAAVTSETVIDGNVTINAVFAKTKTRTGFSSTPATAIVAGGEYIMGAAKLASDATMYYFSSYSGVDENISWGVMSTTIGNAIVLTASGTTSTFQLKDGSNNYVAPLQTGKFKMSSTTESLSMTAAGAIKADYYLRHNYNSGSGGLRWYNGTSTGTAVYLYAAEYSYSNLTILCPVTYTAAAANVISNGSVGLKLQEEDDAATSISDLEAGATVLLSATPDDGYAFDAWTVMQGESNITSTNVAGNVLTMPAGNVTVSASFNKIAVESVTINGEANVQINNDVVWTLEITPNTARPTVVWSTANDAVATVNNGTVHGVAVGSTTITATVDGTPYNKTINVIAATVLNSISISTPQTEFTMGDAFVAPETVTANYIYEVGGAPAPSADVTASATVSGYNMNVSGEQTVIVSYENKDYEYTINVAPWTLHLQTKRLYGNDVETPTVVDATITTLEAPTALNGYYVTGLCEGYTQLGYITSSENIDALPAEVLTSYTPSANNETLYGVFQKTNYEGEDLLTENFSSQEAFNTNFPTTTGYTSYSSGSVRLGSGGQGGSITSKVLDLSHKFKVEVSAKRYTNDNNVTLYVKVGSTPLSQENLPSSYPANPYVFEFNGSTTNNTVQIYTSGADKRLDINSIHIYTLDDIEYTSVYDCREPKDVTYEIGNDKVVWTACANTTVMEGQEYTLCANEPSLQGYDFGGWIINGDEENVKEAGTSVEVAEDLTITPKFTEHVYDYSYALAATATNGTITSVSVNGVVKALNEVALHDGDAVVVTATPNTNYEISEWTHSENVSLTTDGNTASFTVAENAGDMTITAVFVEKAQYTMTLNVFGRTCTTKQGHEGDSYSSVLAGAESPAISGYDFQGWSTDADDANAIISGEELLTADVTLYAIVGSLQPTGYVYNKVTSLGDITDDGYYLIVNETANKAFDGSRNSSSDLDAINNYINVTVNENQIISNSTIDAAVVTIVAIPETDPQKHYIKTATGYYIGGSSSNGLNANKNDVYQVVLTVSDGNLVVDGLAKNNKDKEMYLQFNNSASRFGFYGEGNQNPIQLYKRGDVHQEIIPEAEPEIEISTAVTASTSFPGGYIGDVTIVNGGSLNADISLSVGDLIIHSTLGKGTGTGAGSGNNPGSCGQVANGNNLTVTGDVYLELELTQDAAASAGWYAFSVPFPVDAMNGVYYGNTKLTNEVGYAIMSHYGDLRAKDEYAWKKFRGIMQPGVFYVITVGNTDYKTLRFKKVAGEALVAGSSVAVSPYPTQTGNNKDGAWNGIGNPNLQISNLATSFSAPMQFYDHKTNSFTSRNHSMNLVVGSAFFIQYDAASTVSIPVGTTSHNGYLAPQRERNADEDAIYEVSLTNMTTGEMEDNLFLTAREDATNEYEIGRDLAKMSMGTAKCAQMWVPAYGTNLCAADFPLVNDKASYPLTITTPAAGDYRIELAEAYEDATIYLTYEGRVIWNLSMSPYEVELQQGQTEGYGLRLVAAPQTPTDIEQSVVSDQSSVQKVIIDEHVYILRGDQLFDVTGKAAR